MDALSTTPDGRELRETTGTADHRQAQEYHDTRKAECSRQVKLGERPRHTWQQGRGSLDRGTPAQPLATWNQTALLREADPFLGALIWIRLNETRWID